jgi:hypothetical protein
VCSRVAVGLASCQPISPRSAAPAPAPPPLVPRAYGDLEELFHAEQGIYRTCGPNGGVCHHGREYPNLATLASLVHEIGRPCNPNRDDPTQVHDLCERAGDRLRMDDRESEIAWIEEGPVGSGRDWRIRLREPAGALGETPEVAIARPGVSDDLFPLTGGGAAVALDADPRVVRVTLPRSAQDGDEDAAPLGTWLAQAGNPGDPASIRLGDPNRNGVFGADLGGAIVAPGAPERSYLLVRLVDPDAGPLMPRANCCAWSRPALHALWCWVAGLSEGGANALAPIDYARCGAGPPDAVAYPAPGPECETSGECPPRARRRDPLASFDWIYRDVIQQRCAGGECHIGAAAGGLDMSSRRIAYESLVVGARPLVVAGNPGASELWRRVSPPLCGDDCMPRGAAHLDDGALRAIETWIAAGARP